MTFAFLPNYFKKIGIVCFFVSIAITITAATIATIEALSVFEQHDNYMTFKLGYQMGQEFIYENMWIGQLSSVLLMLSMATYMLAKEKVDDEYMDAMRWESLRLSIIISIVIAVTCIILDWRILAKTILFIQFTAYLITFKIKKSQAKSSS